jgi:hypothetical protein
MKPQNYAKTPPTFDGRPASQKYDRRLKGHAGHMAEEGQKLLQMHKQRLPFDERAYTLMRSASASAWRGSPPGTCSPSSPVGPGIFRGGFAVPRDTRNAELCLKRY